MLLDEENETQNQFKSSILLNEFNEYGYKKSNRINKSELTLFLDRKSPSGEFDHFLSEKLFNILDIIDRSTITIVQFIEEFLWFVQELRNDTEKIYSKFTKLKENYNNILEKWQKYNTEKLNREGFYEEGKLYGEIIDINLRVELEGMQEIILKIIYSGQESEIK